MWKIFGETGRSLRRRLAGVVSRGLRSWFGSGASFDRWDERRAVRFRKKLGKRGRLISWGPESGGGWRVRLSSVALLHTLERVAPSRAEAIERADQAVTRLLASRDRLQAPGNPASPSSDRR